MKITLIQLIGEQILPNLYPVIAFKPDILVNVYSEKTKLQEEILKATVQGIAPNLAIQSIYLSASPSTEETQTKLQEYIKQEASEQNVIITNYTGGTKLMCIGAYLAAKESTTASIYLDTQLHKFSEGKTSSYSVIDRFLGGEESTKKLTTSIPLCTILTAHQFLISSSQDHENNEQLLALARGIDELKQFHPAEVLELYQDEKQALKTPEKLLLKTFDFGNIINKLCVEAGLMRWSDENIKKEILILAAPKLNRKKLKSRIKYIHSFLSGCWWELLLISSLKQQIQLQEILWSVEVRPGKGTRSEEDILARIDTELFCFSCKISDWRGQIFAELHKLSSSTKDMGGSHSQPILAIYNFTDETKEKELREIADKLKITIITRKDLSHLADIDIFKSHSKKNIKQDL